jgi:hypothetical protein
MSVSEKIERLYDLKTIWAISEYEFINRKNKILWKDEFKEITKKNYTIWDILWFLFFIVCGIIFFQDLIKNIS